MRTRIKQVRQALGYSQRKFGAPLGMRSNSISQIESGVNRPTEQFVKAVCREYGIREEWLRTGEGEMKKPEDELEKLARAHGADSAGVELIRTVMALDPGTREQLLNALRAILEVTGTTPADISGSDDPDDGG